MSRLNLQVMKQISEMLALSTNCTCVLQEILISLVENAELSLATVFLKNEKNDIFILSCSHPRRFPRYKSFFKSDQFMSCFNESQTFQEIDYHFTDHSFYCFSISLPLQFDHHISGVIVLLSNKDTAFSEEDYYLLKILVNQIGLSIENELLRENAKGLSFSSLKVLDSLTEGVMIINHQTVVFSNSKMNSLIGAKRFWVDNSVDEFLDYLKSIAKDKVNVQLALDTLLNDSIKEYRFFIETATNKYLRVKKFPLDKYNGSTKTWGMIVNDFTQYKNSEKLKDDLIATVSHELRTPLTSIKGNASALLRNDITWPVEDQLLFIQDIYEEADRLNDLIGKLLDFSKINAGALKIDPTLLTVQNFVANLTHQLAKRYKDNFQCITMNVEIEEERIKVDEQRIIQVIYNLIDNAFKHNSNHVPISITVKRVEQNVQFTVRDKGIGIPKRNLERIFDKYYQKDGSAGFGLGLAICKGFISIHNGDIWAESGNGSGSSFHFTIPIARG